jgi:RsiW-degrading membrane proteinase PrsW (M82 family)
MTGADQVSDTTTAQPPLWSPAATERARHAASAARPMAGGGDEGLLDRFLAWPLRRTARAARISLTAVAVAVAAIRLPAVVDGEWSNFRELLWYQVVTVGWLLLATVFVRTITPRHVISFWLLGIFFAGPLVDGLGAILDERVSGNAFQAGVVPVLEELAKLVPVVGFAALMGRAGRGVGAVDCCILGLAVGGGFGIYEDMLWGRAFSSGFEGLGLVFPSMLQEPLFASGHMVWTGCAALGVGVLFLHRRRRWAWALAPVLIVVPWADHAIVNYGGEEFESMRSLVLDGTLTPWLLLAGLAVAVVLETGIVSRSRQADHLFQPATVGELLTSVPPPPFSVQTSPRQLQRLRNDAVFRRHAGKEVRIDAAFEIGSAVVALERDRHS